MKKTEKRKRKRAPSRWWLTFLFTLCVFCILLLTMIVVGSGLYLLYRTGVLSPLMRERSFFPVTLLVFILASVAVGTLLSLLLSRVSLRPVHILMDGMERLARGDYGARIDLGEFPAGKSLAESFNLLAGELENTEMLRSDFINGFSHEFKTPIVSILGFARLLNRGGVPEEQRAEYLEIIEEESARLAAMATNVLNMTKIENQNILTGVTEFNLSEQLRTCVLLLEKKWEGKGIRVSADFDEHMAEGNEELLKQVWINILDNAVKFTPEGGEISLSIREGEGRISVEIRNTGSQLSPEDRRRMFRKFYQGDASRKTEGNGLGLSIAQKVVELHRGRIAAESGDGGTTFTVELPAPR